MTSKEEETDNNGPGSFDIDDRRRLKHMTYVTSGCGKNKDKDRIVGAFWDETWPKLEKLGWKKVDGEGQNAGSMSFYPHDKTPGEGTKGQDYYDRIKDVLERLREKRSDNEANIIDDFDAEVHRREQEEKKRTPRKRKSSSMADGGTLAAPVSSEDRKSAKHDSWKEGRKFAKKTSRVGANYQPSSIPNVGDVSAAGEDILLWDSQVAEEEGSDMDKVVEAIDNAPPNKKFEVLCKLAEEGHKVDDLDDVVSSIPFTDGSDWDDEKKLKYSKAIFKHRKNLAKVCKEIDIDMKSCLVYYYGTFKNSTDYRLMKAIVDDQRYEKTASLEVNTDVCAICDDGGELVICDECEGEYHLKCMRPPLKAVPAGRWECDECVDRKVLQLRNYLLYQTNLTKEVEEKGESMEFNHSDEALEAIRTFSMKVSEMLVPIETEADPEVGTSEIEIKREVEVKAEEVEVKAEEVEDIDMKLENGGDGEKV